MTDVPNASQKPDFFGGLKCLKEIFGQIECKFVIYIGDHEADVQIALNIQKSLGNDSRVISVAVAYSHSEPEKRQMKPDYIDHQVSDISAIIQNLVHMG